MSLTVVFFKISPAICAAIPQLDVATVCPPRVVGGLELEFEYPTTDSRSVRANGIFGIGQEVGQSGFSTLE